MACYTPGGIGSCDGDSGDDDTTVTSISQSHHGRLGINLLLLQKQHCIGFDILATMLVKKQVRDDPLITALHIIFSHCSVADTQDEVLSVVT